LVVTNTSSRFSPEAAIAAPTPSSLRYARAVSMCRYPTSSAWVTTFAVSSGGTRKTPNPSCGIVTPLVSSIVGTVMGSTV
jgi:hypothetical protein